MVLFPGALGDFICFLPALERLALGKEADLFARTEYADLLPPPIGVRSLECHEIGRLFVPGAGGEERLKRFFARYSPIYSWLGGGQRDFAENLRLLSGAEARIFPFRPCGSRIHMVDYFLSCLGIGTARGAPPDIPIRSDAMDWCRRFWRQNGLEGKKALILAPGSGAREKNWPAEFYTMVAEWWEQKYDGKAVVVLGPVEEERARDRNHWGRAVVIRGLDLARLAAFISRSDFYLGNDSGITHLAAALGVETVALFGPTAPWQWAPYGKKVTVITKNVDCSPCPPAAMKSCPHHECLTALTPACVISRLEELLEKTRRSGALLDKGGGRD